MSENIKIFKALGEETRYLIAKALILGERCACELPKLIGRTQSNTSMHLAKLLGWDIIKFRKDGKRVLYSIKDKRVKEMLRVMDKGQK